MYAPLCRYCSVWIVVYLFLWFLCLCGYGGFVMNALFCMYCCVCIFVYAVLCMYCFAGIMKYVLLCMCCCFCIVKDPIRLACDHGAIAEQLWELCSKTNWKLSTTFGGRQLKILSVGSKAFQNASASSLLRERQLWPCHAKAIATWFSCITRCGAGEAAQW